MPVQQQIAQIKKGWIELWYKMSGGVKSEYDNLLQTDIIEFYHIYDLWLEKIKAENKKHSGK